MTNIREMVTDWLTAHGYEGLYNSGLECGCGFVDLMPCDEPDPAGCRAVGRFFCAAAVKKTEEIFGPKE
jgi:hypothetical protein